jgi:hypothetical protein
MSNLPPQMQHGYPGQGPGGAPPVEGPSLRERMARAKTLARRAAGHWKMSTALLVIGMALALLAALNAKRSYRSECSVQFKAGLRMGADDDSPTEKASKLMPKLQDELKTRARLEKVIREFNLYPKIVDSRGMSDAVDEMRDKHIGFRGKGDSTTFVISFDAEEDPELAQKVTQRLADTMIDEYTKGNLSAVTANEAFLSAEEARSERELEAANKAFAKFLAAHPEFAQEMKKGGGTTPGAGGTSPIVMPTAVNSGDPQLEALKRQRARIEAEIKAVQTGAPAPVVGTPAQEARLAKAKRDREDAQKVADDANANLAKLRAQGLSDEYPDVKEARNTLTRAKASLTASDAAVREAEQDIRLSASAVPSPGKVDIDELKKRMDAVDQQIAAQRYGRATKPPAPTGAVDAGAPEPVNEIVELETEWQRLLRTLQESKEQHDDLNTKLERARLEKARAAAKGGDTMTILDPAYKPTKPSAGGKGKVAMTGGAVALIVALLYAFARVVFNDTMIDAQDIEALKLIPVLGVLPKIPGAGGYGGPAGQPPPGPPGHSGGHSGHPGGMPGGMGGGPRQGSSPGGL